MFCGEDRSDEKKVGMRILEIGIVPSFLLWGRHCCKAVNSRFNMTVGCFAVEKDLNQFQNDLNEEKKTDF